MAKDNNLQDFLIDIANTIREKTTTRGLINPQDFSTRIRKMESFEYLDISNDPLLYSDLIAYSTYIRYTDDLDIIIDLRNNIDNISEIIPNIKFIAINFNALIKKLILGEIVKTTIKDVILEHLTQTLLDDIPRISRNTFYIIDVPNTYTYIEALEDDLTVSFTNNIQYSLDIETWQNLDIGKSTSPINKGEKIYFKRITDIAESETYGMGTFSMSKKCNVGGNIMSLLFGDDYIDKTDLVNNYTFYKLFKGCANIIHADKLLLPTITINKSYCYSLMFNECTSLITTPELPATTLAAWCYDGMFNGCTSLTTAPELPATTLAYACYYGMFEDCTALQVAPELPAVELADCCYHSMFMFCNSITVAPELRATVLTSSCYYLMFWSCSKLNKITMLATDISATDCLKNWVKYVPSNGTFIKNKDMESLPLSSVNGIPYGWVVEDYISELDT